MCPIHRWLKKAVYLQPGFTQGRAGSLLPIRRAMCPDIVQLTGCALRFPPLSPFVMSGIAIDIREHAERWLEEKDTDAEQKPERELLFIQRFNMHWGRTQRLLMMGLQRSKPKLNAIYNTKLFNCPYLPPVSSSDP